MGQVFLTGIFEYFFKDFNSFIVYQNIIPMRIVLNLVVFISGKTKISWKMLLDAIWLWKTVEKFFLIFSRNRRFFCRRQRSLSRSWYFPFYHKWTRYVFEKSKDSHDFCLFRFILVTFFFSFFITLDAWFSLRWFPFARQNRQDF